MFCLNLTINTDYFLKEISILELNIYIYIYMPMCVCPTVCGVSEYNREASTVRKPWTTTSCWAMEKKLTNVRNERQRRNMLILEFVQLVIIARLTETEGEKINC